MLSCPHFCWPEERRFGIGLCFIDCSMKYTVYILTYYVHLYFVVKREFGRQRYTGLFCQETRMECMFLLDTKSQEKKKI